MCDDGIERRFDRRKPADVFDQRVARRFGVGIVDRVACGIFHRPRMRLAGVVGEGFHLAHRKGARQIVDNRFARAQVDIEFGALFSRHGTETSVEHRFGSRDELEHHRFVISEMRFDVAQHCRELH